MSNLVVITFDNMEEAGKMREALFESQKEGFISLDDSAVIVRDEDGKVHVKNQMDRGEKIGAVGGGVIGLLIAGLFFPVAGIVLGALGGLGIGKLADVGVDRSFVKQVSAAIEPGTSALFVVARDANKAAIRAALEPFKGTVYQTTLDPETEETLRRALK